MLDKLENRLSQARALFNVAHVNKTDCDKLIELTLNSNHPLTNAYYAAGIMVSSKYTINPFKIMKIFNAGKEILEDLISENYDNVEMRYLRYSIQLNTPKFAGYYKNIEHDREILVSYIKQHSKSELTKHMMIFINNTNDIILKNI